MPIYEYICQSCGKGCEILQKISDPAPSACPHCGKDSLKKRVSASGFRLSGGGWYETDFKTGDKRNLATGSSDDSGNKSGKSDKPDKKAKKAGKATGDSAASSAGKSSSSSSSPATSKSSSSSGKSKSSSATPRSN